MDKGALLDRLGLAGEDRLALAKVLDKAEQASGRNIPPPRISSAPSSGPRPGTVCGWREFPRPLTSSRGAMRGRSGRFFCSSPTGWSRRAP